ncbi:MAG: AGE family epimerase/isomerase [Candidatus Firestonebacteria bacterium]|nr:AGE family epimerase/isomerase [Candidatus Firestonebacteria bacterium]
MNNKEVNSLNSLVPDCLSAAADGIELVLSRFEKNRNYPFIDTKLSTITGEDFVEPEDLEADFFGRTAIFGWIQGRGLEALAGHADFFKDKPALTARFKRMLSSVAAQTSAFKKKNGHFVFLAAPDGRPFKCGEDGRREYIQAKSVPPGFADLFTGKGLAAAGVALGNKEFTEQGVATFRFATSAVLDEKFESDQISFDPKNPAVPVPGRFGQGHYMIGLGGYALYSELFPGADEWIDGGSLFLRKLIDLHILKKDKRSLKRFDFVEFINEDGLPWLENGKVLQDPGHALEFTGLAAKFLLNASGKVSGAKEFKELYAECTELLPEVFLAAFENGFQKKTGGICKTFDLVSRTPVNGDMPWWSLPESLRAAGLLLCLAPNHPRYQEIIAAAFACKEALFGPFRSPVAGLFIQTRDAQGNPSTAIPATPDADPGYHTGLCFIDFIKACRRLQDKRFNSN